MANRVQKSPEIETSDEVRQDRQASASVATMAVSRGAQKRPRLVVVCSTRGGVGKTTVSAMLVSFAAANGRTVHAIDADVKQDHLVEVEDEGGSYYELTKERRDTLFYGFCRGILNQDQISFEVLDISEQDLRNNPQSFTEAFDGLTDSMIYATEDRDALCVVDTPAGALMALLQSFIDNRPWERGMPIPWIVFPIIPDGACLTEGVKAFHKVAELRAILPEDRKDELRVFVVGNRYRRTSGSETSYTVVGDQPVGQEFLEFEAENSDWIARVMCKDGLFTLVNACLAHSIEPFLAVRLHTEGRLSEAFAMRSRGTPIAPAKIDTEFGSLFDWVFFFGEEARSKGLIEMDAGWKTAYAFKPGRFVLDRTKLRKPVRRKG